MPRNLNPIRLVLLAAATALLAVAGCGDDAAPLRTSAAGGDRGTPEALQASRTSPTPTTSTPSTAPDEETGTADRPAKSSVSFVTPSKRFACAVIDPGTPAANFVCDVRTQSGDEGYPKPNVAMPDYCEREASGEWGNGVTIEPDGVISANCSQGVNVVDQDPPVLAYGSVWKRDGFTCESKETGLSCRNPAGDRSFTINRESLTIE